jgi:nucleotide-binding universal stress UspA family protein
MYIIRDILVPTDFSEFSASAVEYATTLAQLHGATIHLMHVIEESTMATPSLPGGATDSAATEEAEAADHMHNFVYWKLKDNTNIKEVVCRGKPYREIVRYAQREEIDLIVIATHGRTGLAHVLMGSVAEKVIRLSHVPVLAVKPKQMRDSLVTREDIEQDLNMLGPE